MNVTTRYMRIEKHPFDPWIPGNASILMLGTFPPKPERWSMDFYYPNKINDMWRIMGIIFFGNKNHFVDSVTSKFKLEEIKIFLNDKGIALHDTASEVIRLKDNASDKFLQIVKPINLAYFVDNMPMLETIVTTGEKAASVIADITGTMLPSVGKYVECECSGRKLKHFRMPSTSRAYPMKIEEKARYYASVFSV